MAVTVENSGTQTATVGTEHNLHTETEAKTLILLVDLTNLTTVSSVADVVEIRVKLKVLTGGSEILAYYASYSGAAVGAPVKVSIPVPSAYSASFTLKQVAGTGRNFPWAVVSV